MYQFNLLSAADITPRMLVLSLMSAAHSSRLEISQLVNNGLLLNIEAKTTRVAVTRLLKEGMLASHARGVYEPGRMSKALTNQLREWQNINSKTRAWDGGWLGVHTQHLGRTNRKKLRAWTRALNLNGYAEVYTGFAVRPNNLSLGLTEHRENLISIGLDENAIVTHISSVALASQNKWSTLWSIDTLKQSYTDAIETMQSSLKSLTNMTIEEAARETLLVGQSVIKTINLDPLLPIEISETALFQTMLNDMIRYNKVGKDCWQEYQRTQN